jgi:uncharacterized membrane protein required for colicin V production
MDQLPPNTIVGIIIALFTVLGFLKNFVKFFFNLISLALGALTGLWAYNNGFTIANKVVPQPDPWMSVAIGVTVFVLTIVVIRKILDFLSGKSGEGSQARTGGFGIPGGAFGLLLGLGFAYFMLTGVRYAGTMSELERLKEFVTGKIDSTSKEPTFAKLKKWIDESQIGQWHQKFDFLNNPVDTAAAKLAIVQENKDKYAQVASQQGGEVIYNAVPVDPAVQEAYDQGNFSAILRNKAVQQRIRETFSDEQLRKLDIEGILGLRK